MHRVNRVNRTYMDGFARKDSHERVSIGDCDFPDRLKINDNLFLPIGPGGPGGLVAVVVPGGVQVRY